MGNKSASPAQEAIQNLLGSSNITRAVYIDDVFAFQNQIDVEQALGWFTQALSTSPEKALKLLTVTYPVPDDDIWRIEFRDKWIALTDDEKATMVNGLPEILNSQLSKDKTVARELRNLFPHEFDYHAVSPSTWIAQKTQILADLSETSRLLCLFDQDLSAEAGFSQQGMRSGGGLLKDLLDSHDSDYIICGILSHTISSIETEHEYQQNFTRDYQIGELAPQKFLPLTKSRLYDPIQFADGLKKLLLNELCQTIKEATLSVLDNAHQMAISEIRNLDVYAFDRIVLKAALDAKDDIWEIDTILRLFQIYLRNNVRFRLTDARTASHLSDLAAKARPLSQIKTLTEEHVYPRVRIVRRGELYESESHIRHRPLETGDVFVCGVDTSEQKPYMLLAQPCDLAVRLIGKRAREFVSLVPIVKESNKYKNKKDRLAWQNFWSSKAIIDSFFDDPEELALLEFKESIVIKTSVLDLAVLNVSGCCQIDINNISRPTYLTTGWQILIDNLVEFYKQIDIKLKQVEHVLESCSELAEEAKNEILKIVMPEFVIMPGLTTPSFFPKVEYANGMFNFGLKRTERYRQPGADGLLKAYAQYLAREAKEFDFSR